MCKHVKRHRYDTSHERIVHVAVILMRCCIAGDPECWKSVAPQLTQPELEGLWMLTGPTKELRKQEGQS